MLLGAARDYDERLVVLLSSQIDALLRTSF
jgi:hypothetical protein